MNEIMWSQSAKPPRCVPLKPLFIACVGAFFVGAPAHGGVIYVSNGVNNSVTAYSTTGSIVNSFQIVGRPTNPEGIAFDSQGNLYLAEDGTQIVLKIAPNGSMSTFASGVGGPDGLAFDQQGNLFASDAATGAIDKITPGGSVSTFVSPLALDARASFGLAFDANGNLYDAATQNNCILKITPSGSVSTFATMDSPVGLAFDRNGNLYATSFDDDTIMKITPSGNESIFATGVGGPIGIAFDSEGDLFVAEHTSNGSIAEVSPSGVVTTFVANTGGDPNCIAILVPEPSSLTLITLGLTLLCGARSVVRKRLSG